MVASPNCLLCVRFGHCDPTDPDPKHKGTLLHHMWSCPVLEPERRRLVPPWLLAEVRQAFRADGTMASADLLLSSTARSSDDLTSTNTSAANIHSTKKSTSASATPNTKGDAT